MGHSGSGVSVSPDASTVGPSDMEARLSAIISIAADAIISIDASQRITLFNTGAEVIFGYTAAEAIGQPLHILLPESFRTRHADHIRDFAASTTTARRMGERAKISGRRKSGEVFPAEASISKVEVGGEWVFTVFLRDATERTRTEEGLQFLSEVGRVLNRSLDVGDTLDQVTRAAVPVLADCCVVDILNQDWAQTRFGAAASNADEEEVVRRARKEPGGHRGVLAFERAVREKGHLLDSPWLGGHAGSGGAETTPDVRHGLPLDATSILAFPLALRSQTPSVMAFAMTHSGRQYDNTYVALARELAARVASAIDNAELYRRSQQAVAVRDEVVAIVSHDLRNPLSVIKMCASSLAQEPLPEPATIVDLARTVHHSADWMNTIIQDLLDVARLESGKLAMRFSVSSVRDLVTRAVDFHRTLAEERGIVITTAVPDDLPTVSADASRIDQVIGNLLGNGLKFTEAGGSITLRAGASGDGVVISVSDTGRGVDPDDLPRLFDRFWQSSRADLKRGTGLGLAIAKGIVEAHGGRIWAESVAGQGATFSFTLLAA